VSDYDEKISLVTYADDRFNRKGGRYRGTQKQLAAILGSHPDFSRVYSFTDEDLTRTEWYAKHASLFTDGCTEGAGNAQKAYYIDSLLKILPERELLLYHDCSPGIWDFSQDYREKSLRSYLHPCDQNGGILVGSFCLRPKFPFPHLHRSMSSPALVQALNAEEFLDHWQWCTSWILLRNVEPIRELVKEWLAYNVVPAYCSYLATRDADRMASSDFIENRGDQSILTLLMLKRGMRAMKCRGKNAFDADASAPLDDGILPNDLRASLIRPAEILKRWSDNSRS
jgi:hypothetical protein